MILSPERLELASKLSRKQRQLQSQLPDVKLNLKFKAHDQGTSGRSEQQTGQACSGDHSLTSTGECSALDIESQQLQSWRVLILRSVLGAMLSELLWNVQTLQGPQRRREA